MIDKKGVLLPYQVKWIEDKSDVKVIEKSRRIGISWTEASDSALFAARATGDDVWYIGYNKEMAREFIDDCAFWAKNYAIATTESMEMIFEDDDKDILSYTIRFASGHRITSLSSRPNNLRGKSGRVIIDEAAFHENLQGLIKASMAFLIWGGSVRIISTHFGEDNPFNDLVQDIRKGKIPYSLHRVSFDEALQQGLCKQIFLSSNKPYSIEAERVWRREIMDFYGDHADEELHVIPSGGEDVYLSRALILSCMDEFIPVVRLECEKGFAQKTEEFRRLFALDWCETHLAPVLDNAHPNKKSFFGEDFGRSGDLTVIMPAQEDIDLKYRCLCAIELRNVPFKQQEQILFYMVDRLPRFSGGAMDARGNGQYLAEVTAQRYGDETVAQVMPSQKWYLETMPKYKSHLEDQTLILPKDADLLSDNRLLKMVRGFAKVPEGSHTKGHDGGQRHGDGAIAAAMLTHALENDMEWAPDYEVTRSGLRIGGRMGAYLNA